MPSSQSRARQRRACDWQGPEVRRGRVRNRGVPSLATASVDFFALTPYMQRTLKQSMAEVERAACAAADESWGLSMGGFLRVPFLSGRGKTHPWLA